MVDLKDDIVFFTLSPEQVAQANPFGDFACVRVETARPLNASQLAEEIGNKLGETVQVSVTNPNPGMEIGPDNLALVYVTPVLEEAVIMSAVNDHVIDPLYGVPAGQEARIKLAEKLGRGEELTTTEMNQALLLILSS